MLVVVKRWFSGAREDVVLFIYEFAATTLLRDRRRVSLFPVFGSHHALAETDSVPSWRLEV